MDKNLLYSVNDHHQVIKYKKIIRPTRDKIYLSVFWWRCLGITALEPSLSVLITTQSILMLQRLLPSDLLRDAVEDLGQIITDS